MDRHNFSTCKSLCLAFCLTKMVGFGIDYYSFDILPAFKYKAGSLVLNCELETVKHEKPSK